MRSCRFPWGGCGLAGGGGGMLLHVWHLVCFAPEPRAVAFALRDDIALHFAQLPHPSFRVAAKKYLP